MADSAHSQSLTQPPCNAGPQPSAPQQRTGAAYIRVSTGKQEELSPDSQKRLILDYARSHSIAIPQEFIFMENGISGRKANKRPLFQEMIALAKAGRFQVILLWKFSRFARNQEESIVYKSMLRKSNVEVISISEPLVDGPFGSLIERIIEWMDEFYSIRLSGDVYRGMTEKAMRGGYQSRPALGYRVPYHNAVPEIVEEEAQIVRKIYHDYVDNRLSPFQIARSLNSMGLKTGQGKPFEKRSVEYILDNPCYAGYVRWNLRDSETQMKKEESEWIIRKGPQPPIISRELFEAAVSLRGAERAPRGARPAETYTHWLSGVLKCSTCGRSLVLARRKGKSGSTHYSFQCYGYNKGLCPVSHSISAGKMEAAVLAAISEVLQCGSVQYSIRAHQRPKAETCSSLIKKQLERLDWKEQRLREAYMEGVDTLEEYKAGKHRLEQERNALSLRLADEASPAKEKGSDENPDSPGAIEKIHSLYDILISDRITAAQKNTALRSVIDKIVYNRATSHIDIYYCCTSSSMDEAQEKNTRRCEWDDPMGK